MERNVWWEDYSRIFSQNIQRPYATLIHDRGLQSLLLARIFASCVQYEKFQEFVIVFQHISCAAVLKQRQWRQDQ